MKYLILIVGLVGLQACQPYYQISVHSKSISVSGESHEANRIDSLVMPYQEELSYEMDQVIAFAAHNFTKGRPNGSLNNWSASAVLSHQFKESDSDVPIMVLLNVGGLRSPINKGEVTIGDIFKLMPFDNEVVWVKLPASSLKKIEKYLSMSGGEPIAGAIMTNGKIQFSKGTLSDSFWVITSDYLMNGGDRMDFFQDRIDYHYAGILLRDLFIEESRNQETLNYSEELRIEEK